MLLLGLLMALIPAASLTLAGDTATATSDASTRMAVWWLAGLAAAAAMFNQVVSAWRSLTGGLKEQPPPATTYRTLDECEKMHDMIATTQARIENALATMTVDLRKQMREDVGGVHQRVDAVQQQIATHMEKVSEQIGNLSGQLKTFFGGYRAN